MADTTEFADALPPGYQLFEYRIVKVLGHWRAVARMGLMP